MRWKPTWIHSLPLMAMCLRATGYRFMASWGPELDNTYLWPSGSMVLRYWKSAVDFLLSVQKGGSQEDVLHDAAKGADPVVLGSRGNEHFCSSIQQMDSETLVSI